MTKREINADELALLENDEVWNLIDDAAQPASGPKENPMFARNVMREIRLLEDNAATTMPWYKRLISGSTAQWALTGTALGAAAACVIAFTNFSGTSTHTSSPTVAIEDNTPLKSTDAIAELNSLEDEIYAYHDADPVFISEEEIASIFEL